MATRRDADSLDWRWCRIDGLAAVDLQNIYMARQRVFALEQQCIFLDADGLDERAWHLAAWSPDVREPLAYARVVDPGVKYGEPSLGRVLTARNYRGSGLGRRLVGRALRAADRVWPGQHHRISAQARLVPFYASFGFAPVGDPYDEDGMPHVEMLRR